MVNHNLLCKLELLIGMDSSVSFANENFSLGNALVEI